MTDTQYIKLPELTQENIAEIMKIRIAETQNDNTAIPMLWQGFLEMELHINGETRTAKLYIPKNTPQGTTFVLLNIPDGEDTIEFMQKSGWVQQADLNEICLFAAEPNAGGWSVPEKEQIYLSACLQALIDGVYFRGGMTAYAVGYGRIGAELHKLVLSTPLRIAAAAFINASDIGTEYLKDIESRSLDTDQRVYHIALKEIPVPVWVIERQINASIKDIITHWANAIGADVDMPEHSVDYGNVYHQKKKTVCTPEGNIVQTSFLEADADVYSTGLTAAICSFLIKYARYTKDGPFGNSLVQRVNYKEIGVERRFFADADGISRECLIYVPKTFRKQGNLPLVFALHGACESTRNYFEESLWYQKADEEGFIVVIPEGTLQEVPEEISGGTVKAYRTLWQISDASARYAELDYLSQILDQIIAQYPVDTGRIYCTGHSMGCIMTNFIGSSPLGQRFAALAATSGVLKAWDPSGEQPIPIWLNMGQYDLWSYDIKEQTPLTEALNNWLVRNKLATEENADEIRTSHDSETYIEDRHNMTIWKNQAGAPMVIYEWIQGKDHMNTPEDNRRFWDLWFSKWKLDKNNNRSYNGTFISNE